MGSQRVGYNQSHHFMTNRWGNNGNSDRFYFGGAPKSLQMVTTAMELKDAHSLEKSYNQHRQHIKKQKHYFANKGPSSQRCGFTSSHVWMWQLDCHSWTAECQRINAFELWCWRRLLRVLLTARRSNQSILKKSVLNIHWKDWYWSWISNTLATWCKELTHWKRPWCWERMKVKGKGDDRGWDGWMASPIQWMWVWESSGSWWWTGKPAVLQSIGSQRVRHDWATELNWLNIKSLFKADRI